MRTTNLNLILQLLSRMIRNLRVPLQLFPKIRPASPQTQLLLLLQLRMRRNLIHQWLLLRPQQQLLLLLRLSPPRRQLLTRLLISTEQRRRPRRSGTVSGSKTITTMMAESPSKRSCLPMLGRMAAILMRFPRSRRLSSEINSIRLTPMTMDTSPNKILLTSTPLNTIIWLNKVSPSSDQWYTWFPAQLELNYYDHTNELMWFYLYHCSLF